MSKEINIISKLFESNFKPLTCEIFYNENWNLYLLMVNEIELGDIQGSSVFYTKSYFRKDNVINSLVINCWYSPFDKFIPHLSDKLKISTKMEFNNGRVVISEKRRVSPETFEPGFKLHIKN